ncbi:hypothetical protein [Agromyces laixinhei]|uniref:hypothetical protein n=1 Tax=Agromyces laixinhei TaxID=2585717 RepID=UPI0012EE4D41|nr:hypothetical protein [Agromyces laixinhei]
MSTAAGPNDTGRRAERVEPEPVFVEHTDPRARYDRKEVVTRETQRYGGVKVGSAFLGWVTATGATVLLIALVAAVTALVAAMTGGVAEAATDAQQNLQAAGIWGVVILLVIWFVAYYCGGYVAGRMARFNGVIQGIAVWGWSVVIAIILTVVGLIAGQNLSVPSGAIPTLPFPEDQATMAAVVSIVIVAVVALGGAILGGLAGMRFHRMVDREGLGE